MDKIPVSYGQYRISIMAKATYIHGTETSEQERLALLNRLTNPSFISFLELKESMRVLEIGSGLGILVGEIANRISRGAVFGIEYSADQLKRAIRSSSNLHMIRGDGHSLPFPENQFDAVYCRYVLEHVADPVHVLREMLRVLKSGGAAYAQENNISVVAFDPDCPMFDHIWRQFATLQTRLGGDALIGKRLYRFFREAGFRNIQLSYAPEIHHAGSKDFEGWVINLIGNVQSGKNMLIQEKLATTEEIDGAIAELESLMSRKDASALFHWNRASAKK
ncbi:MAG: hypothetical protein C5B54_04600 [Acidobacteria bacterium]|nr:MAG: hypothetical protein C5B54_04600 [Acidobacteriota bacterium]